MLVHIIFFLLMIIRVQEQQICISGKVHNYRTHVLIESDTITVNEDGIFVYYIPFKNPSYHTLKSAQEITFFLNPGDSIFIEFDEQNFYESIRLSGDNIALNRFLLTETRYGNELSEFFNANYQTLFKLDEHAWKSKIRSLCDPFRERLQSFIAENPDVNPYFVKMQSAMITYGCAELLIKYPGWYREFSGNKKFQPSEEYYSFLDTLNFNDAQLYDLDEYRSFLRSYVSSRIDTFKDDITEESFQYYSEFSRKINFICTHFTNHKIRSELLFEYVNAFFAENNSAGAEDILRQYSRCCQNSNYVNEIMHVVENNRLIRQSCDVEVYKKIGPVQLEAFIYKPENMQRGDKRSAVAFFHGGGWDVGKPEWGDWQCRHFASQGLVAVSFEYRLHSRHNTTPLESMMDAKSAIRWMRKNAYRLDIDPQKIIASGYSAGGHIAMCTAMIDAFNEPGEETFTNCVPNALMLWVTPVRIYTGWFTNLLRGRAKLYECNPVEHVKSGLPPTIIFQGTADDIISVANVKEFTSKMKRHGNRCDLHLYEGQTHLGWGKNADDVLNKMDGFLISLGYMADALNQ